MTDAVWNLLAVIGALSLVVAIPVWRGCRDLRRFADYWYDRYRETDEQRENAVAVAQSLLKERR